MFTGSQVNLYAEDVERSVAFYRDLGFEETYRYPPEGEPVHVELSGAGLTIGVASPSAAREEHGIEVSETGAAMELCLWCDDVDASYEQALAVGATPMSAPHDFQEGRLRVAWVADPTGNPIELVRQQR